MQVRQIRKSDWPNLYRAMHTLFPRLTTRQIAHALRGPAELVLICEEHQEFAGYCELRVRVTEQTLWIHTLGVDPDHRQRGVAQLLLQTIEQRAALWGCREIGLNVYARNTSARRLYEACQYQRVGRVRDDRGVLKYHYSKQIAVTAGPHLDPPGRPGWLRRLSHFALYVLWRLLPEALWLVLTVNRSQSARPERSAAPGRQQSPAHTPTLPRHRPH